MIHNDFVMKNSLFFIAVSALLLTCASKKSTDKQPVDCVDPLIGTEGTGNVLVGPYRPHGMVKPGPDNAGSPLGGYEYRDTVMAGFSHIHLEGTGGGAYGNILIYPMTGSLEKIRRGKCFSSFSHENEKAEVGYYSVVLDEGNIKAELTATEHAGFHRYTFPESDEAYILLDVAHSLGNPCTEGHIIIESHDIVKGYGLYGYPVYFYAVFNQPFSFFGTWSDARLVRPYEIIPENVLFVKGPKGEHGLKGEYFDNKNLAGQPVFTRIDKTINFRWGMGHPERLPLNGFSVRWTGTLVAPETRTYKIRIDGDDGIRFWLNDSLLIDQWVNRGETADIVTVPLEKGKPCDLKIEYYENVGVSLARLKWDLVDELGEIHEGSREATGDRIGAFLGYETIKDEGVEVRIGISHVSIDQARKNLEKEIPEWNFHAVMEETKLVWDQLLKRIVVEGGSHEDMTKFYTALYHAFTTPTDYTEDGQYYYNAGGIKNVFPAQGRHFYCDDWCTWDTFRSTHPLQNIVEPERRSDVVWSYIQMYRHADCLPNCPGLQSGCSMQMNSNHAVAVINDIYKKEYRNFDAVKALEAMKKQALTNPTGDSAMSAEYIRLGYVAFEYDNGVREKASASITLECAYDDWCIAQMAKALGEEEDYQYFMKRSRNYKNLFDPETGFIRPRHRDGSWKTPFDPASRQGNSNGFTESNAWQMTWFVPHDLQGLFELMGGHEKVIKKLDAYFAEGLHNPGNEPGFINPFLYNFAGAPWKSQKEVRKILKTAYGSGPDGLPGNDDSGALSAWYALAAAGLYPVTPGSTKYVLTSPLFEKVTIDNGAQKRPFVISAKNTSDENCYIQSATLNGKMLENPWIDHADIMSGGTLILKMGKEPDKEWGSDPSGAY